MIKAILQTVLCIAVVNSKLLQAQSDELVQERRGLTQAVVTRLDQKDEVDYTFNYKQTSDKKTGYDYGPFLFGSDASNSQKGMESKLHVSTALNKIAIPNKDAGAGSFVCTEANSCKPQTTTDVKACSTITELYGYNLQYYDTDDNTIHKMPFLDQDAANNCSADKTFLRWNDANIDDPSKLDGNMDIYTFNKKNDNLAASVGLIGLAPKSNLFTYIQQYTNWNSKEDYINLSLSYSPNSGAGKLMDTKNVDTWKQNQFIIKGKRNNGDITFESELIGDLSTWTVGFATFNLSDDKDNTHYEPAAGVTQNVPLCLASDYPYMVGLVNKDASDTVKSYFNKGCKDPTQPQSCPEKDFQKNKVKKASIQLASSADTKENNYSKYDLTFETEDILYFNGDQFNPIVGQNVVNTDLAGLGCDATTQIVVGRPFLAKYEAVIKQSKSKVTLAFIPNEGTSSIFLIILIILGCIILAICIAIILLKVCKRKSAENDDYEKNVA